MTIKTLAATAVVSLLSAFGAQAQNLTIPSTMTKLFGKKPQIHQSQKDGLHRVSIASTDQRQLGFFEFRDKNKNRIPEPGELESVNAWLTNKDGVGITYDTGGKLTGNERTGLYSRARKEVVIPDANGRYRTDQYGMYIPDWDFGVSKQDIINEFEGRLFNTYQRAPLPDHGFKP